MVYLPLWKMMDFVSWNDYFQYPIGSMYAIYGNIYHQYTPNVSIYAIHGSYGYMESHKIPWFQSTKQSRIAHLVSSDLGSKNKAPHATQGLYRPSFHMIYIYQHLPTIQTKGCKRCMCLFFSHLNAHPMPAKCPFSASSASTVASAASSPESAAGAVSAASRAWASAVAGASSLEASKGKLFLGLLSTLLVQDEVRTVGSWSFPCPFCGYTVKHVMVSGAVIWLVPPHCSQLGQEQKLFTCQKHQLSVNGAHLKAANWLTTSTSP